MALSYLFLFLLSVKIQKDKRVRSICYKLKVLNTKPYVYLSFHSLIHLAKFTDCCILGDRARVMEEADSIHVISELVIY